ncbi:cytochrome c oxidase subunit 4 [Gordonia humi]|uniref:Cytochrome c oxidase polypeptide 4 n=1 Tax=Gordonia humi TaxID=686429 RepID=A0A840F5Y9_9ACTN|nr:cytochrome c oxidase subunit 4 [Gordonia humi]MBB4136939.1 hypothetical protein [Gordonia humi]
MKVEARIFEVLAVFFILMGVIYTVCTFYYRTGVEWAGAACMFFAGGLALIAGTYFRFVARRVEIRPEDFEEAEIEDGAGELGFFSPGSYWPIMIAGGAALFAIGFATANFWFAIAMVFVIVGSVAGLVFEYHVGPEKH